MKKICFILWLGSFMVSGFCEKPEQIFLDRLKQLSDKYQSAPVPLLSPDKFTEHLPERQKATTQYELSLSQEYNLAGIVFSKVFSSNHRFPAYEGIEKFLKDNKALTPERLYLFFKNRIEKEGLTFKNGDLVFTLPSELPSYRIGYILDSAFSHFDMIFIDPVTQEPKVIYITYDLIGIFPLADYLSGLVHYLSNFAIYRFQGKMDESLLGNLLETTQKNIANIHFDTLFYTDYRISNPATFLDKPVFYYCGEFITAIYMAVTHNEETILVNRRFDLFRCLRNLHYAPNPMEGYLLNCLAKKWDQDKNWPIEPGNYYKSASFAPVVLFEKTDSVRERFKPKADNGPNEKEIEKVFKDFLEQQGAGKNSTTVHYQ